MFETPINILKNSPDEIITGEKFYNVADFIYSPNIKPEFDDYNKLENTFNLDKLKDKNIIYTHTLYVKHLINIIKELKDKKFVLITHNSDLNIDETYEIPENVIFWFAQNVGIKHHKLISLPIGLENSRWFPDIKKQEVMREMILKNQQFIKSKDIYLNCNINNFTEERKYLYDICQKNNTITVDNGRNGVNFHLYLAQIYSHRFVLCPRGNGFDTHRLWETLYMGSMPIVKKDIWNLQFRDLPILYVDSWTEILSNQWLIKARDEYNRTRIEFLNLKKLTISFWKQKIKESIDFIWKSDVIHSI